MSANLTQTTLVCTHRGCLVELDNEEQIYVCPCHGSEFRLDGTVLRGPAKEPLKLN
jgi:cytochrome b6-f complex iron-sulfur subunit